MSLISYIIIIVGAVMILLIANVLRHIPLDIGGVLIGGLLFLPLVISAVEKVCILPLKAAGSTITLPWRKQPGRKDLALERWKWS